MRFYLILAFGLLIQMYFYTKVTTVFKYYFPDKKYFKKYIFAAIAIFFNSYPIYLHFADISFWVGLRTTNVFVEYFFIYPFWILFLILIQSFFLFIVTDFLKIVLYSKYKKNRKNYLEAQSKWIFYCLIFIVIYVPSRIVYDDQKIDVIKTDYIKQNLNKDLNGFKIALISDIQADYYTSQYRLNEYVSMVNNLKPDIILVAGDMITHTPDYIDLAGETIAKLEAKYGVFISAGDHDHWAYRGPNRHQRSLDHIRKSIERNGAEFLVNKSRYVEVGESKVKLSSSNQTYARDVSREMLMNLLNDSIDVDLKLFMNHQPNKWLIDVAEKGSYDIFLAGHTHGGQIVFPFPFYNLSGSKLETNFVNGIYQYNSLMVAITSGLGVSIAPVRYNATPNIIQITLRDK